MTTEERHALLNFLRREYYEEATTGERKLEIGLIVRGYAEEEMPSQKCMVCKHGGVMIPDERPRFEGHVYSLDGHKEWGIMKMCEWCFDLLILEPDDARRAEWWPDRFKPFYTCGFEGSGGGVECDFETMDKAEADSHEHLVDDHWIVTGSIEIEEPS